MNRILTHNITSYLFHQNQTSFYMKQLATFAFICFVSVSSFAQKLANQLESALRQNTSIEYFEMSKSLGTPSFIQFKNTNLPTANNAEAFISDLFQFQKATTHLIPVATTELKDGISVAKYKQVFNGVTVDHSTINVNLKDGKIHSIVSEVFDFSNAINNPSLTETAALDMALAFVNAKEYSWQSIEKDKATFKDNPAMVTRLSQLTEAKKPKGLLVYARDIYGSNQPRLAWKFDVYGTLPLSRNFIYVDAANGKILLSDAIIKHADKINASAQAAKAKIDLQNTEPIKAARLPMPKTAESPAVTFSSVLGTAQTRYAGTRNIYTTQLSVGLLGTNDPNNTSAQLTYSGEDPRTAVLNTTVYILKDDTRGLGIETYDMNGSGGAPISLPGLHENSLAFVDLDNNWKNETAAGTHEDLIRGATSNGSVGADEGTNDDYAIDAHWGAEMVYDYWKNIHNRLSFDNKNSAIKSYTHYGPAYDNAFWNGSVMTYGDGSGTSANNGFRPLTSLDVCGHEIGHGICSFTSDLVYQGESGAMNEALSDIWAACVENFTTTTLGLPANTFYPFQIGEQIASDNIGLRRMDNPKAKTDPDTYGGRYWQNPLCSPPSLANDQCGVHTNSGVLNKYFYLLVKGPLATTGSSAYTDDGKADSGTTAATENLGNVYAGAGSPIPVGEFIGLGFAKAEAITYLMELNLTPNSTYANARVAAINAARLLYGACSQEEKTVTDAFFAVNVGARYLGCSAPTLDAYALQTNISEGVSTNTCPRFNQVELTSNLTVPQVSATTITFTKSAGTLSNNEWAYNTSNTITFNAGETGVKSIFINIFDDAIVEGNETIEFTATSALSSLNKVITINVLENDAVPSIGGTNTLLNENFEGFTEGGLPSSGSGWIVVNKISPTNIQWAVRTDGAVVTPISYSTKRVIIEQTAPLATPGEATYDQNLSAQMYLRSPQIVATGLSNLTVGFNFQAGGEAACSPACDYAQLVYSYDGINFEQFNAAPMYATLTETSFSTVLPQSLNGKTFYLGILWYNDANAGTTASIAIDNFVLSGNGISIDSMSNTSKSEHLTADVGANNYFYSYEDNNIMAVIKSTAAFDYGCTEVKVEKSGSTPFVLFTNGGDHKVAGKVIKVTPTTNNATGAYEITLYFTEHEIRKLEEATGKTRTQFYIYKVNSAAYTGANSSNTTFLSATYAAISGGGTFKASFSTGFSSFAIGFPPPLPNLSPTISVLPASLVGTQSIGVVVSVYEFNTNPTSGTVTAYIPKDAKYVLSFNPTATTVSGVAVQNTLWTFDGTSNPGFYILSTNSVIAANSFSKFGLTSTFNPNSQKGSTLVKVILLDNSGGESAEDNGDNQNQSVLVYTF